MLGEVFAFLFAAAALAAVLHLLFSGRIDPLPPPRRLRSPKKSS